MEPLTILPKDIVRCEQCGREWNENDRRTWPNVESWFQTGLSEKYGTGLKTRPVAFASWCGDHCYDLYRTAAGAPRKRGEASR